MSFKLAACIMALGVAAIAASPASAQKKGGTLRLYHNDNPPSTSLLEESTIASVLPFAAVFNNLVVFDPAKVHESIDTVIPDLAESWSWDQTNTKLTFKLRQGVKWHDGQPFTAKDVQCTWRMLTGKSETQDFKRNPRKVWYSSPTPVPAPVTSAILLVASVISEFPLTWFLLRFRSCRAGVECSGAPRGAPPTSASADRGNRARRPRYGG